jgi:hypothetical protein
MATAADSEVGTFWVQNPEVDEVLDLHSGSHLRHEQAIGTDYEQVIKLHATLQDGIQRHAPLYACAMCKVPVYLVSQKEERKFFFRHTLEDGRCSARTRGLLSQDEINARRYNGVKESQTHINMKTWVAESLRADPDFTEVEVEQRWSGQLTGEWRKPDVRAKYRGTPVVFEVQLSTTYLNVITARRSFYLREGALLLWVFAKFDVGPRRLTQDDVFFNNNRNAFVIGRATRDASVERKAFHLECIWATPSLGTATELNRDVVPFSCLTLDAADQRAYYFDFEGARTALFEQARQAELQRLAPLREGFEAWFLRYCSGDSDEKLYAGLREGFACENVELPWHPGFLPRVFLNALYSAKHGRPVGWDFQTFMEVLHHVHGTHKGLLRLFRRALEVYERGPQVKAQDKKGKWRAKVREYTPLLLADDPRYRADTTHDALGRVLFPELYRAPL